jgi:Lipocalin-like domain
MSCLLDFRTRDEEPDMKKLLSPGIVVLFVGMIAMTQSSSPHGGGNEGVQGRLIGAWRLAWREYEGADGKIHRENATGLLIFARDGHMSLQVMSKNPSAAPDAEPVQHEENGYQAFFGTFQINESTHTVAYHVEGALERTLVGKDLPRALEFSGKQLIVNSTNPDEHWRVAWEHY